MSVNQLGISGVSQELAEDWKNSTSLREVLAEDHPHGCTQCHTNYKQPVTLQRHVHDKMWPCSWLGRAPRGPHQASAFAGSKGLPWIATLASSGSRIFCWTVKYVRASITRNSSHCNRHEQVFVEWGRKLLAHVFSNKLMHRRCVLVRFMDLFCHENMWPLSMRRAYWTRPTKL